MKYRAIVKPNNSPENWVLDMLDGDTINEFLNEVDNYMEELGIYEYEIVNVRKVRLIGVAFEDIILN